MFSDTVTISPTAPTIGTGSDVDFVTIGQGAQSRERLNDDTTLSDPEKLIIKHQQTGSEKTGNLVDRHLISLSRVERDSDGNPHTCVVNLTIAVPRNGLFSTVEVERQLSILENFLLGSGNVGKILMNQA